MLNFCGIVVAILRMAIGRNFSMSVINSGHHYLPTYQILWKIIWHFKIYWQLKILKIKLWNIQMFVINIYLDLYSLREVFSFFSPRAMILLNPEWLCRILLSML
jgi:hypothetical protein